MKEVKIIKRYQNRKLYDTQQSCYVTLDDIAKMIRSSEDVMVIDNKTKNDITAATLTQIIFEAEKKASQYAPLFTLREIIPSGGTARALSKEGFKKLVDIDVDDGPSDEELVQFAMPRLRGIASGRDPGARKSLKEAIEYWKDSPGKREILALIDRP